MFGYNTLGFGSIAGTSGPPDLDFTVVGNNVERGNGTFSDVAIGTANTHRMVVIYKVVQKVMQELLQFHANNDRW